MVDLLIGVDHADLYSPKDVKGLPGEPIARLGWTRVDLY